MPSGRFDDESSDSDAPQVGDCIDAESQVVDCAGAGAEKEIVSDQSEPDAIARVAIGDKPQEEATVAGGTYCVEDVEAAGNPTGS